jgi:hypothetical protein
MPEPKHAQRPSRSLLSVLTISLALGCVKPDIEAPPPDRAPPQIVEGGAIQTVSPRAAAPGEAVTIRAGGFSPNATVSVGIGLPRSEYEVVAQARANAGGDVATAVRLPGWVERGQGYVFVLDEAGSQNRATSGLVHVTTPEGRIRLRGRLTDEGVECRAMRTLLTDELYTLAGDTERFSAGDEVVVEGTIAEMSICMQGTTVSVSSIRAR